MRDVIELVVKLDDTTVEHRFVELGPPIEIAGASIDPEEVGSSWLRCKSGLAEVSARRTTPPKKHPLAAAVGDRRSLVYIGVSLAVHLVIWALATEQPPEPTVVIEDPKPIGTRVVGTFSTTPSNRMALEEGDSPDIERDGGGAPTLGLEGKAGGASQRDSGHARLARRETPAVTREGAIESARTAGILGSTSLKGQGFAAITGTADPASGFDRSDVQGPLYGGSGEASGTFGMGRVGFQGSAGCTGANCNGLIGTGRYGTISNGRGRGDHWGGDRAGAGGLPPQPLPTVRLCAGTRPCVIALGALDKAIIRRYVRRELPKIQYCYEKELLAHPELEGDVTTRFLIHGDGTVASIDASGVSDEVSSCVAGVIKNIQFPKFEDGSTDVRYPFTFHKAGS